MKTKTIEKEYWTLSKHGPRLFSARATAANKLCRNEVRTYFSRDAFEREFGKIDFEKPVVI